MNADNAEVKQLVDSINNNEHRIVATIESSGSLLFIANNIATLSRALEVAQHPEQVRMSRAIHLRNEFVFMRQRIVLQGGPLNRFSRAIARLGGGKPN